MFFQNDKTIYDESLPVLPTSKVFYPHSLASVEVSRNKSINALKVAINEDNENKYIVLIAQRDPDDNSDIVPNMLYEVGVLCEIKTGIELSTKNSYNICVKGIERVKVRSWENSDELLSGFFEPIQTIYSEQSKTAQEGKIRGLISLFEDYIKTSGEYKDCQEIIDSLQNKTNPEEVISIIVLKLKSRVLKHSIKQEILEESDLSEQVEILMEYIQSEKSIKEHEDEIKRRVRQQVDETQKQMLMQQLKNLEAQLKGIQEEDEYTKFGNLLKKLQVINKTTKELSEADFETFYSELQKLKNQPNTADAGVARNYLDFICCKIPWGNYSDLNSSISAASKTLDKCHYGLRNVKKKVLQYVAIQSRKTQISGKVMCFFGPPGIGKTTLAESIAEATGRKFFRISLAGMRDESEIKGHRRTYVAAMPGKIVSALIECKTKNPVILLDELSGITPDARSNPEQALLEVLDPAQNKSFKDNYLDVGIDISQVLFITTTNDIQSINPALFDRLEIVEMYGYNDDEKTKIAQSYLLPKAMDSSGLKEEEFSITTECIQHIIEGYTKEAGVRELYRQIHEACSSAVLEITQNKESKQDSIEKIIMTPENISKYLGKQRYHSDQYTRIDSVGSINGLAFTRVGGAILEIQVAISIGTGKYNITGNLGNVMKESVETAIGFLKSNMSKYKIDADFFKNNDIHIHCTEGGVPKDGPSAGITICTALLSAIKNIRIRSNIAMTGEINLFGEVMAIGGLKEKIQAAVRNKISEVLIPLQNEKDLEDITGLPESFQITTCSHIDQVFAISLLDWRLESNFAESEREQNML